MLESRGIPFTIFNFSSEKIGALETARLLDIDPDLVYKTIVITRGNRKKTILVVIPGTCEVDLKLTAALLGEKKVLLPTQKEAEEITGLKAGGISPLSLFNRGFAVILDEKAGSMSEFHISGGQRGLNIRLPVKDFIKLTNAQTGNISKNR